ncbi:Zn-dependent oligopeptidase [Nocardioides sp. BGMRC 2183]|nr:Zn-dependent oligopeptidase [Nocardioides sp. BGMRC 2183]
MTPLDLPTSSADDHREVWSAWVSERARAELAAAEELVEQVRSQSDAADPRATLQLWDRAAGHLGNAAAMGSLIGNVHPDAEVRDLAEAAEQDAQRIATRWSLDRGLYDVFAGLDTGELAGDPLAERMLAKVRNDFRRSGVDRDDATRERIAAINERLTELDQEFSKVIRDDVRTVRVTPDRLDGLPEDFRTAHPAGEDGLVTLTTDYPDVIPVRMFARDQGLRRDITVAFLQRGWPDAEPLLTELFALRHELATTVGFEDWPSYDADVKMIGTGAAIPAFIDRIADAAAEPLERDLAVLLERYRQDFGDATAIEPYDASHYQELVRAEQYQVDSQQVRTYFDFAKVRQGLLEVTGRLFGLRYQPVQVATWHADVASYDVVVARGERVGEAIGRIHLDLHPREGKYKHAAQFTLTDGVAGVQAPEGVLVCNFPRGLMEHDDVVTLFHEFGHLLHHVLAGHGDWFRFAGVATEWDFVEAPSQMLEEWAWDAEVLQTFATDASGTPIPTELVEKMRAADDYGKGIQTRTQMFYASMSYWFHRDPADAAAAGGQPPALTDRMIELQARYAALPYLEGTHMFASFGHLGGYSSGYYTYMWSLVIAKDLFSAFSGDALFDPEVAGRYRDRVLARGGQADAADLVADFLGRAYSFDAYGAWLAR